MANRQGLQLVKSRRRDPRALDFGNYALINGRNVIVYGGGPNGYSASLDHVEEWLTRD